MPVSDRIRARVREKDCFVAILPDNGFSIPSPMNSKVFPIPGSNTTGNRDIDDGLATINYNSLATGDAFDFVSGNYGARFYLKANLAGQTPHHTVMMRVFVTDMTNETEYPYVYRAIFCHSGGTSYLDHTNLSCSVEIDGQRKFYGIRSYACFQTQAEYEEGGSSATRSSGYIQKAIARADLSGRWMTLAAAVDNEKKLHCLYLNGELMASARRSTWTAERNVFSQRADSNAAWLGHTYANKTFTGITSRIAWAATFSSVLTQDEIKYLSEE